MRHIHIGSAVLATMLCLGPAHGQTISKCQDADGNWHYGDFAAEACAEDATVTEINQRGIKVRESEAPPTAEELAARKAAAERERREQQRLARQRAKDQRLLQTYGSARAIIAARDQRVDALDRELAAYRLFRQDLVDEKQALQNQEGGGERISSLDQQIAQYDQAIQSLKEERRSMLEEYNQELERYRELTDE